MSCRLSREIFHPSIGTEGFTILTLMLFDGNDGVKTCHSVCAARSFSPAERLSLSLSDLSERSNHCSMFSFFTLGYTLFQMK